MRQQAAHFKRQVGRVSRIARVSESSEFVARALLSGSVPPLSSRRAVSRTCALARARDLVALAVETNRRLIHAAYGQSCCKPPRANISRASRDGGDSGGLKLAIEREEERKEALSLTFRVFDVPR